MAIAFDAVNTSDHSGTSNFSWTMTPAGTPTYAAVYGYYTSAAGPTSVTYGGTAMTKIADSIGNATVGVWLWMYVLPNPPAGAQTVQVNKASDGQFAHATSITYTGTDTTSAATGNNTTGNDTTSSSTTNVSLTAAAATSWFLTITQDTGGEITGATSTGSGAYSKHAGGANVNVWDSNGTVAGGADTIVLTWAATRAAHEWIALEIRPPAAVVVNSGFFQFM